MDLLNPFEVEGEFGKFITQLEDDPFFRILRELYRIKDDPRTLIIVTHGFVELIVNTMIDGRCKNRKQITDNVRDYPHSAKVVILNEAGVLTDHHFKILNWLRKLRNKAAHEPFFKLTTNDLEIFSDSSLQRKENFPVLCRRLLVDLLRKYKSIIAPVLLPTAYDQKTAFDTTDESKPSGLPLKADLKDKKQENRRIKT